MAHIKTAGVPSAPKTASPNGIVTGAGGPGVTGVNQKKQKKRAKQAARQAEELAPQQSGLDLLRDPSARNGHVPQGQSSVQYPTSHSMHTDIGVDYENADLADPDQFEGPDGDDLYYTEDDTDSIYDRHYGPGASKTNGHINSDYSVADEGGPRAKKKRTRSVMQNAPYNVLGGSSTSLLNPPTPSPNLPPPPPPPPLSSAALRSVQRGARGDRIWNTSTQEERENIKKFWLSLGETERRGLVKIEKEAVLRKMKEQQKYSCSCTVCGRRRNAIEEELEVLYDAYYEELEQYAHHQQGPVPATPISPVPRAYGPPIPHGTRRLPDIGATHQSAAHPPPKNRIRELADDGDEEDESDEDDEDYSEDEDEDYSDDEDPEEEFSRPLAADLFNFGSSLTVKADGVLTIADDLLSNDGKRFIEMMEQLAERRMQREEEAQHNHDHPPVEDEYDDEEDDDYESGEDDDYEEEDEMGAMTEEQRMEEGRRMFQIFAARMFEQRVLQAYREKVAAERQQKLLEELEDESRLDAQREAKKARDAEKKKNKKQLQKQAKAEEKAKKDAEKAAEEAAAKALEEKKQEEQRRRREEQKKKKEAERKVQEEERVRKEAEKQKRLQEERERQQEVERKLREQKAQEKKAREGAKKREREEREAKEKEARDRKAQDEKDRKEREAKARVDREVKEREKKEQLAPHPQIIKRPSQPAPVALPTGLHPKQTPPGVSSPHVQVATPALPKAPTPARQRRASQQGSHGTSPKNSQILAGLSKPVSPSNPPSQSQHPVVPKAILQKPPAQPPVMHHPQPTTPLSPIGPPPGMHPPFNAGFNGMPPFAMNGYSHTQGPMMHNMTHRAPFNHSVPLFPHQPLQPGPPHNQYRSFPPSGGLPGPPPGMNGMPIMPHGRAFAPNTPPGFAQSMPPVNLGNPAFNNVRDTMPAHSHSRQQSMSEKPAVEPSTPAFATQPIARPAPIKRPSSPKLHDSSAEYGRSTTLEVDELADHLGSAALRGDDDEPIPPTSADARRPSSLVGPPRSVNIGFGASPLFSAAPGDSLMGLLPLGVQTGGSSNWNIPGSHFGPSSLSNGPGWGSQPSQGWSTSNNTFGHIGGPQHQSTSRMSVLRQLVCNACKHLTAINSGVDDFHDIGSVIRDIEGAQIPFEGPIRADDVLGICETFGDDQNGGGLLS
ncbi:hypothetical protein B0A49_08667, partial [Cryomyces minteri]